MNSKIVLEPLITETTISLTKNNWYSFRGPVQSNKNQLKEFIEKFYRVDVIDIKTMVVKGKLKRSLRTRKMSRTANWKKIIVRIKEGQKIEVFDIAGS